MSIEIKKLDASQSEQILRRLIARYERKIRMSFREEVLNAKKAINITELANLIETGQFELLLASTSSIPEELSAVILLGFIASGENAIKEISLATGIKIDFNPLTPAALRIMADTKFRLVNNYAASQQEAIREVLLNGIARGLSPIQQARELRAFVGLSENQVKAVNNFRAMLERNSKEVLTRKLRDRRFDRTINRAIQQKKGLEQARIDRMVDRYRERSVAYRATMIARTEALRVIHQGSDEVYSGLISDGIIDIEVVESTWRTANDTLVRHSHDGMNDQKRRFGESFISDSGNLLRYPGDEQAPANEVIHCRCIKLTRFIR